MLRAGVDLGGTKIQTVVVDDLNRELGTDRRPTPTTGTPADVADAISDSIRTACADADIHASSLAGVGIGSPGQINPEKGTVANAGNLPGWTGIAYPLASEVTKRVGVPAIVGNDVQVAVNAEVQLGAGREFNSLLGVFCGTGVGGGIVIDRELWLGRGAAGEVGHVLVEAHNGAPCNCGLTGCMEAYAGRASMEAEARRLKKKKKKKGHKTRLFKIMKKKGRPRLTSGVWAKALEEKDPLAEHLINRAIWALGAGIGSSVNMLDVEAVIIGGGLGIRLGQPFVKKIEKSMQPRLIKPKSPPKVLLAELGDLGGALGAALLAEQVAVAPRKNPSDAVKKSTAKRSAAAIPAAKKAPAKKAPVKKVTPAKKAAAAKKTATPAKKTAAAPARRGNTTTRKATASSATRARQAPARKAPAKQTASTRKAPAKRSTTTGR